MTEAWPEGELQRTRRKLEHGNYFARNGKIFFKRRDRTRAFVYEAELKQGLLHLRSPKASRDFTPYDNVDALLAAGWAIE